MNAGLCTAAATVSLAALAAFPGRASAQECSPSRAMLILDKSSSMQTGLIGGQTKWSIAVDAIDTVVGEFEANLEMGLMLFPEPSQCSPGAVYVGPALFRGDAIASELQTPPPDGGNYTPIAQTLSAAASEPSLASGDANRYAVLITDGWQWCDPYDPNTRFDAVDTIEELNLAGVTTYVVGFGDSVDAQLLNQLSVAAGTALAGCDPNGDTPMAANPCYYQADDPDELVAALTEIAVNASDETCDGIDNDCDGMIDENLMRECQGGCGFGTQTCDNGSWGACSEPDPEPEQCDGVDNDCDGSTDEEDTDGQLCGPGLVCEGGTCQPPGTEEPPPSGGADDGGMSAGCGCRASTGSGVGGFAMLLFAAIIGLGRRRGRS